MTCTHAHTHHTTRLFFSSFLPSSSSPFFSVVVVVVVVFFFFFFLFKFVCFVLCVLSLFVLAIFGMPKSQGISSSSSSSIIAL